MPAGAKKGERRGGRQKGTPNKDKLALQELVDKKLKECGYDENFNPVVFMVELAANPMNEVDLRLTAAKESAQYLFPKFKAVQHSGEIRLNWVEVLKEALDNG